MDHGTKLLKVCCGGMFIEYSGTNLESGSGKVFQP